MKVVVTGASGFFGVSLVSRLVSLDHEVVTFGRSPSVPAGLKHLPIRHVSGDVLEPSSIAPALLDSDVLFHMAGLVSYRRADRDLLYAINVDGTRNVMQAALNMKRTPRIIHLASIAGMGIPPVGTIGDESLEYNLAGRKLFYCDTKHEGEQIVLDMARQQGLPAISLNPGITFGEGDTHPHHHTIFASMAKGILLGYPVGGVMFSDIRDIVDTAINAMTQGRFGERYVVGSANMSFRDAALVLSQVIGSKPPPFPIPNFVSDMAGTACEAIFPLFGRKPALTRAVAWLSQNRIFFSSDKAIAELGHKQTPFEDTVRRTSSYYLQTGDKHVVHGF